MFLHLRLPHCIDLNAYEGWFFEGLEVGARGLMRWTQRLSICNGIDQLRCRKALPLSRIAAGKILQSTEISLRIALAASCLRCGGLKDAPREFLSFWAD